MATTTKVFLVAHGDPRATDLSDEERQALRGIGRTLGAESIGSATHAGCAATESALKEVLTGMGGRPLDNAWLVGAVPSGKDPELCDLLKRIDPEVWPSVQAVVKANPRAALEIGSRAIKTIRAWAHRPRPVLVAVHPIVAGLAMWEETINHALAEPPRGPHCFALEFVRGMRPCVTFPGEVTHVPYQPPFR